MLFETCLPHQLFSQPTSCRGKKAFAVVKVLAIAQIALAYLFDGLDQAVSLSRILSMSTTPSVIPDGADVIVSYDNVQNQTAQDIVTVRVI
jgi:hypothetical protein